MEYSPRNLSNENMEKQLERYIQLAQISSDWFWETDADYIIIYMSESVERITGFPKEKYIGMSRYDLASEETKRTEEWKQHLELVSQQKPIKNFEYKHTGSDGHTVYLRVNAIPLYHQDGTYRGYLGTTTDISELLLAKMQAEELYLKLQTSTKELETAKAKAEKLAMTDMLTGLNNRRAFFEYGKAIEDMARRYWHGFSIIMIDIDNFKNINDTHGHAFGDIAIKAVANVINKHARTTDISARLGGEEFVILLPQTVMDKAENIAERLREGIETNQIPLKKGMLTFTASFGIAQCQTELHTIEEVLFNADKALYQAKNRGRNQVVTITL